MRSLEQRSRIPVPKIPENDLPFPKSCLGAGSEDVWIDLPNLHSEFQWRVDLGEKGGPGGVDLRGEGGPGTMVVVGETTKLSCHVLEMVG